MATPPWVVYVQRTADGPWGKKEFWKYSEAFNFLKIAINKHKVHDAALNCKRFPFAPPMRFARIRGKYVVGSDGVKRQATKAIPWAPKYEPGDPDHKWCMYCRRPTIFRFYSKHKRLGAVTDDVRRCCICGASERIAVSAAERKR